MADTGDSLPRLADLLAKLDGDRSVLVFPGPEGGWPDAERAAAEQAVAVRVSLGPTVLRTETAPVAVCAAAALRDPVRPG